jgi:hypothetical protein
MHLVADALDAVWCWKHARDVVWVQHCADRKHAQHWPEIRDASKSFAGMTLSSNLRLAWAVHGQQIWCTSFSNIHGEPRAKYPYMHSFMGGVDAHVSYVHRNAATGT